MKRITLTKGLPASGKTTWAREQQAKDPNIVLVNKDELRAMLHSGVHSKGREAFVLQVRDSIVVAAIEQGHNVIVHDTNLHPKHYERIRDIAADYTDVETSIEDFTHISLEECIARDQKRANYVGEKVIRQMYNQYLKPKPPIRPFTPGLPLAIICDIDGTLALFGDANPYDRDFLKDEVNMPVATILEQTKRFNVAVLLVSGRMDKFRQQTEQWLLDRGVRYDHLFMRKTDDIRKDYIVKSEIYEAEIKGKYNIEFVLDDRDQVVSLWRSLGLACLQVAEGAF